MTETGLFFGSFNPVHIGHMAIANYIAEYSSLKEIWFVVSPHNPLKNKGSLLKDRDRLYMTELAVGDDPRFRVSDIEFTLPQPSFTIDTLAHLAEKHPSRSFTLIMGEDNLVTLYKWKNAELLVRQYPIIVYPRLFSGNRSNKKSQEIIDMASLQKIDAPVMEITGTFIRGAIREGRDVSWFVPSPVWKYIREMHFYE
ncbi:MAG: nicotinate (nicotinamide) nucleotide adenylyltransferase [Bacteroidales bacterium]|jgi:nicotinate-nucleotide adenylyltransferase|nr:nicotinate (nicotinamide) nucleotide adenylyltransferase [Bacteroidales bacterium]